MCWLRYVAGGDPNTTVGEGGYSSALYWKGVPNNGNQPNEMFADVVVTELLNLNVTCLSCTIYFTCCIGTHFGTVIALPLSGVLCDSGFLGGWPSAFYVFGRC
jgi:hypothetical protein